jgi:hypothetical protein
LTLDRLRIKGFSIIHMIQLDILPLFYLFLRPLFCPLLIAPSNLNGWLPFLEGSGGGSKIYGLVDFVLKFIFSIKFKFKIYIFNNHYESLFKIIETRKF